MKIKQIIIVRHDLNMRKGKVAAQVAHASMKVILDKMYKIQHDDDPNKIIFLLKLNHRNPMYLWLTGLFTKIVLYVNSLEELMEIKHQADELNIPNAVITDAGRTEFHGEPTITCIAIGPDWSDKIDQITGDLPLL